MASSNVDGLVMDTTGNIHYQFIADGALMDAIKGERFANRQNDVMFKYSAAPRIMNIDVFDICCSIKPFVRKHFNIMTDNGINGATQGRLPITATITGIPSYVDNDTYYAGLEEKMKQDLMKQDYLQMFNFACIAGGNYTDVDENRSAIHTGLPGTVRGRVSGTFDLTDGVPWIPPMTQCVLGIPDFPVSQVGYNDPVNQNEARVRFTAVPWTAQTSVHNITSSLLKLINVEKNKKTKTSKASLSSHRSNLLNINPLIQNDLKLSNRYLDSIKGMILIMRELDIVKNYKTLAKDPSTKVDSTQLHDAALAMVTAMTEYYTLPSKRPLDGTLDSQSTHLRNHALEENIQSCVTAYHRANQPIFTTLGVQQPNGSGYQRKQKFDFDICKR